VRDSLDDKKRSLQQQIDQLERDIKNNQIQTELKAQALANTDAIHTQQRKNDEVDYKLKLNPLSNDEKNSYALQIESARITVAEKQLAIAKSQLKSPVDGVILTVDGHP
jgi:multidrug resistance efflux pump